MNMNQKLEIHRLSGYMERINAILHEMESFGKDCSDTTRTTIKLAAPNLSNAMDELAIGIVELKEDEHK